MIMCMFYVVLSVQTRSQALLQRGAMHQCSRPSKHAARLQCDQLYNHRLTHKINNLFSRLLNQTYLKACFRKPDWTLS